MRTLARSVAGNVLVLAVDLVAPILSVNVRRSANDRKGATSRTSPSGEMFLSHFVSFFKSPSFISEHQLTRFQKHDLVMFKLRTPSHLRGSDSFPTLTALGRRNPPKLGSFPRRRWSFLALPQPIGHSTALSMMPIFGHCRPACFLK